MESNEIVKIQRLLQDYPNRVPIMLKTTSNFSRYFKLIKTKYLISGDNTVGLFMYHLKKINNIKTDKAIYMYHYDTLLNSSDTFGYLKIKYNYEMVLILTVDCENVFG